MFCGPAAPRERPRPAPDHQQARPPAGDFPVRQRTGRDSLPPDPEEGHGGTTDICARLWALTGDAVAEERAAEHQDLKVIAHAAEGFHLVRDGFFATWGHVHLDDGSGVEAGSELHLECEHVLADVLAATPAKGRGAPLLAHAHLVVALAGDAHTSLIQAMIDSDGELKALPYTDRQRLLGQTYEAVDTLSELSSELAYVLLGPSREVPNRRAREQATRAALAGLVVLGNLRTLQSWVLERSLSVGTSRNGPCPCGSGRKYKLCCGKPGA